MRVALGIEYDGSAYNGVQEAVDAALSTVADETVESCCAGRTDTGVHASGQVIHFDTTAERSRRGWLLGVNSNLPDDIGVSWVEFVPGDFHARYSATSRSYRYLVLNRLVRSALFRERAWWVHAPIDEARMQAAGSLLLGEHDFSAFRAAGCQARSPMRELTGIVVERHGDWIAMTVTANAFLQHMVRNIAGLLVEIGSGERPPEDAAAVLESRDRRRGGITAPAQGLTLIAVDYPPAFGLPAPSRPELLPGLP